MTIQTSLFGCVISKQVNIALQVIYNVILYKLKIVTVLKLNPEERQFGDISQKMIHVYYLSQSTGKIMLYPVIQECANNFKLT